MKLSYQQLGLSKKGLVVGVTVESGTWTQFGVLEIPWGDLTAQEITDNLDRAHRRKMLEAWSQQPIDVPLF